MKSIDKLPEQFVNLDQYLRLYDFMNEKLVLSKEALQRLKESFEIVRGWFMQDLTSQKSAAQYFETLFKNLPLESSSKQSEFLYMLNQIVLTQNQNVLNRWKDSYAKNLHQSL